MRATAIFGLDLLTKSGPFFIRVREDDRPRWRGLASKQVGNGIRSREGWTLAAFNQLILVAHHLWRKSKELRFDQNLILFIYWKRYFLALIY
jgi:hypothetical protein